MICAQRPHPPTLHAAAEALARGQLSSEELCQALLLRAEAVEAAVHAFRQLDRETILAAARAADARRAQGRALSPWDGLPVAIKDNIAVAGQPCGCAAKILEGYVANYDATVVARLKAAGIVCFGRANMDEFAMGSSTEYSGYGPTGNPWNTDYVPGGSSGGSAAAVAAGEVLAALGSDTGGSIRQPAGFCGVVGLKPTYGCVSRYGLVAFASSLDQIGPIANDVRDAALLYDLIAGPDPRDNTSLPATGGPVSAALDSFAVKGLRLGMPKEYFEVEGLAPEVRQAVERAIARYQAAGAEIVPVSLPNTPYAVASYYVIATAEASSNLARFDGIRYGARAKDAGDIIATYFQTRARGFGAEVKRRIILGTYVLSSGYYDAYYLRAQKVRTLIRRDFQAAFAHCDLVISPVAPTPAFRRGESCDDPLKLYLGDIYTIPVNMAGLCGIAVPCGQTANGLPLSVQLIGGALAETRLCQAAHWFCQQQ